MTLRLVRRASCWITAAVILAGAAWAESPIKPRPPQALVQLEFETRIARMAAEDCAALALNPEGMAMQRFRMFLVTGIAKNQLARFNSIPLSRFSPLFGAFFADLGLGQETTQETMCTAFQSLPGNGTRIGQMLIHVPPPPS